MEIEVCRLVENAPAAWTATAVTAALALQIALRAGTTAHRLTSTPPAKLDTEPRIPHTRLGALAAIATVATVLRATGCEIHMGFELATGVAGAAISCYSVTVLYVNRLRG